MTWAHDLATTDASRKWPFRAEGRLFADTLAELHATATAHGLRDFRSERLPHYALTKLDIYRLKSAGIEFPTKQEALGRAVRVAERNET